MAPELLLLKPQRAGGPGPPPLSSRQRDVVRLIAEGLTPQQIAARLGVSVNTVRNHVQMTRLKLGVGFGVRLASWLGAREPTDGAAGRRGSGASASGGSDRSRA